MNRGYIKLYRCMTDWEWFDDIPTCHLFLYLLLKANHEPRSWRGIEINTGECITSFNHLSTSTGLSVQQVRTALKKLESTGEVILTATNKYTRLTLCNYKLYQTNDVDKQQTNNTRDNKQITNKQQTNNNKQTLRNTKEHEEEYIVENVDYKPIIDYLNSKTGKSYRSSTRKTQDLIKARMNEGFTEPDFFRVIDNKVASWQGTKMDKFLRPETLFGSKFEGYLNEQQTMSDFEKAQRELDEEIRRLEDERD